MGKKKKNVRVAPKRFPTNPEELKEAARFLSKWKQQIDDRLFSEGYELRDGVLYERKTGKIVSSEEYWKKRREKRLPD